MRRIKKTIFFLLFSFAAVAQSTTTYNHYTQVWLETMLSGKISPKFKAELGAKYTTQSELNVINPVEHEQQFVLSPAIHYYAQKNLKISIINEHYYNYFIQNIQRAYPEYRFDLQVSLNSPYKTFTITHRLRFEERYIKDNKDIFETASRIRYMLKVLRPLNKPIVEKGTRYIVGKNELFGNFSSNITGNRFLNQNRFYVGYGYGLTNDFSLEIGYLNMINMNSSGNQVDISHVLSISFIAENLF